jgi:hypothetical protein
VTGDATERARWQHVKSLLAQALELEGPVQAEFVESASAGDAALHAELVSLLAAAQDPGDDLGFVALRRGACGPGGC